MSATNNPTPLPSSSPVPPNAPKNPNKWTISAFWNRQSAVFKMNPYDEHILLQLEKKDPKVSEAAWGAYGDIRVSRIKARTNIVTVGIVGAGLTLYQRFLSQQEEKLKQAQTALKQKEDDFKKTTAFAQEEISAANGLFAIHAITRQYIKNNVCRNDEKCFEDYEDHIRRAMASSMQRKS